MNTVKRLGLIIPATNTVVESDFSRILPERVTLHSERLWVEECPSGEHERERMSREIDRAARYLSCARVDALALVVLNDSTPKQENAAEMELRIGDTIGLPVVRTSPAAALALRALNASKVCLVSPYSPDFTMGLTNMLEAAGFVVTNTASDSRVANADDLAVQQQPSTEILEFASGVCPPEADAIFMPCNAWQAAAIAQELEDRTGAAVVTASLATLWRCLHIMGVDNRVGGWGQLLGEMPSLPD